MFLKRIELAGFKSFADKTELEFVQGITAVVGPNGSGKSNISDGIRWVLGEQSAKSLRGGKMEDIIFAGSDSRKAVNFGEVTLTLDNTDSALDLDFSEVAVTRRINRDGDSEYYINKQSCRLKDISELFMDTGIGREAYSIIGQGRIEEILSTRPEDRRGIFEEASAIVKYKSRKKEAQKKLDETEQNLIRIHDLVTELEDQIEPLREQSEKATAFKQLKGELKSNEISMYVFQIEQVHRSWTEANDKLQQLKDEQIGLSTIVNQHDAHLEKHRLESRRLEEELERLRESMLHWSEEFEKCEGFGEVLKERKKNLENNEEQLAISLENQQKRVAERTAEEALLQEKYEAVCQKLNGLQEQLRAEEQRLVGVHGETSSELEEQLKAELLDLLNKIAQIRNEIRYFDQQTEAVERRAERLEEEKAKWSKQIEASASRKQELIAQSEASAREILEIREQYIAKSQDVKHKNSLFEEAQLTMRKWEQRLNSLSSRRDTMRELQNDFDGYNQGVKEVLKERSKPDGIRGIHGAVAELIKVPSEIEVAIEIALGGALQHIVMDSEESARSAIAYLKKRQMGRATFLPLDVIRSRSLSDSDKRAAQSAAGFVGVAAELIHFETKYKAILHNLLGNVMIAETLEQANAIAAKCQYRYRVVTLEGDVVNAGGSMTGGSRQKKTAGLLGRQRLIEQLNEEVRQAEKQLAQLREQAQLVKKEIGELSASLEQLRLSGEQKRMEEQQVRSEIERVDSEMKNAESQLAVYEQDWKDQGAEKAEYTERKTALELALLVHQEEETNKQQAIREAEQARKQSEAAKDALQAELTELKVQVAGAGQEKQSILLQVERLKTDLREAIAEHDQSVVRLNQVKLELENNRLESIKRLEELNQLQIEKQQCAESIDFKRAERAEWQQKLESEENATKEQRTQLKQIEEQLHQTEVRVNRLDVELDNLLRKLSEEYELSYELAKERYPVPEDVMGTQNKVRELKRSISMLGEVNLGAIEEYQRIGERFEFLSTQKTDLIEAKTTLYHVIEEINKEMSARFRETFELIRIQFVDVFSRLFGGGRANLILSDPDHLLDTGIEIVAQPPGKKLQNLQLLSGGERALTAIALLFAILRIKPVPFCVLDEVEAALDEANVSRFAEYLREFSQDTQFIVVTHRKGTMEEADVLYGVTMEQDGVSKLVSVRLEDEESVPA